jgi:Uma2 family endonuclease
MGETAFYTFLVRYLASVLTWLFEGQSCAIHENLNIYQTTNYQEYPLAPDVAVFKGIAYRLIRSWKIDRTGPAPQVVFEIASEETWTKDLKEKPGRYARMGVQEYFAYDPNEPHLPLSGTRRLFGWRLDQQQGIMRPMTPANDGALWSIQLESWLVPDGTMLRLYDRSRQMRLTRDEARERQLEVTTWRAEIEAMRANEEAQRATEAIRQAEALKDKLRSLGVDPDQLI